MKVRFSQSARGDLRSILASLSRHNPAAAQRMLAKIKSRAAGLAQFPHRGQVVRRTSRHELRRLVVQPYVVIFEIEADIVWIVRVVHGARDLDVLLSRETGGDTE